MSIPNPRHVVLITSRGKINLLGKDAEKDNIMPADWHTQVSFSPLMWAVAVGKERVTASLIEQSRCFCINFMPYSLKDKTLKAGAMSGRFTDKFKELGLQKKECEKIDCPKIRESTGFIECEVEQAIDAGDHYVFIGKVLSHSVEKDKRLIHIIKDIFTTTID